MNKVGQADQVIASVITFFVVAVLAIFFINLSTGAGTIANLFKLNNDAAPFNIYDSSLILKNISVNNKEILVIEAIGLVHRGELTYKSLAETLARIARSEDSCLFLITGLDNKFVGGYTFAYKGANDLGSATTKNLVLGKHEPFFTYVSFDDLSSGKKIYLKYYYGVCK